MGTIQKDSTLQIVLKNLCRSYGWSYAVFWSFDQPNSILMSMQDAYFEEEIQGLIDDLIQQAPILGAGLIGQAAFTKKHLWMSSEDNCIQQNSSCSIWDMFQDDSNFFGQFSSGIKTISAIPVEPQGVVQFGSTNKVLENTEFINQTKRMFNEIVNGNLPLISSEDSYFGSNARYSVNHPMLLDDNQCTTNLQPNITPWSTTSSLTFNEPPQDTFDFPTDFGILDEFFQTGDFNISQWYHDQSPNQSNVTVNDQLLSQTTGFLPVNSSEKVNPLTISGINVDLFGSNGDLGDIVTPLINGNQSGFGSYNSGASMLPSQSKSKSTQNIVNDTTTLPPKNGLFSNLGIKELFEGISGTSTSCVDDQVSSATKRRKTAIFKSEQGVWMNDAYSMDGSSTILQTKKPVGPTKPTKKKAKPGTRPRPKDRQMILDRMAELRELIPSGEKMSIDCLLDRTIKHMLFLQSVTKHADRIKQSDEPKHNGVIPNKYSNDPNNNGVTWACELGNQTMSCPLIVEDLSTPGQMLIEMICEEHGFFLEIVDIIRGFGLTILKGVMESREEKIWARFIVETEAKRHVTRHEIFASLVQLLQTIGSSNDNHLDKKVMQTGNSLHNDFQHSGMQIPASLADCMNL